MATTYPRNGHAPHIPASIPQTPINLAELERAYREATDAWIAASLHNSAAQERLRQEKLVADEARYTEQRAEDTMPCTCGAAQVFQAGKAWQQAQLDAAQTAHKAQSDAPVNANGEQ